ncbi:MAG TPA: TonB-dependent receptor plug domain-containing protein, partial [Oceanipulchritudo sp.]|nr:TonB-dependent receptor plug domain-containing protein [Oceanipulchritudo sp.]
MAQAQAENEDVFEFSPFEVSTSQDVGYLSTNSTSGTSLNTAIKDLPMTIQVINQDFITDIAASNLDESLVYAAGVFTSDNQASSSVGATRGTQGGGSGDRSISTAGQGARFANVVYIRGLSTPYQNRMGFRYGGLIVTPNSDIVLGGLLDSANIERIEVVKGPNSLLYGVGVLSGIVNVIPEKPLSEPHYEFSIMGGS